MRFGLIFSLLLATIAVLFAVQNPQTMDVNLLFFKTQGSTALVLILTFGVGVLVGLLSSLPGRIRARRELNRLRKQSGNKATPSGSGESSSDGANRSDQARSA